MRALDLCAGAGGLSLGFKRAGWDVLGVERDGDAWHTHRANVGPCRLADITEFRPADSFDAVIGGVPCQGFSMSGKRRGSSLFRHLIRIGVEANASAILLENVEGMCSWRDKDPRSPTFGRTMPDIIEEAMCDAGYCPEWRVLNCADYGTPQIRKRIIFVAFRDFSHHARWTWPAKTHGKEGARPWISVREALGLGGGDFRHGVKDGARGRQGMRYLDVDMPGTTVGTGGNGELLGALDRPSPTVSTGTFNQGNGRVREKFNAALDALDSPAPCIAASEHKSAQNFGANGAKTKPRHAIERLQVALDRPAPCVSATGHDTARDANRPSRRPIAELRAAMLNEPAPTVTTASSHQGTSDRPIAAQERRACRRTLGSASARGHERRD